LSLLSETNIHTIKMIDDIIPVVGRRQSQVLNASSHPRPMLQPEAFLICFSYYILHFYL